MRPESAIQCFAEVTAVRVIVRSFRVKEASDTGLAIELPTQRQETLVKIGRHALEQRVVLHPVEEVLGGFSLLQLGRPYFLQTWEAGEGFGTEFGDFVGVELADGEERVHLAEDASFVPLDLEPRRIT